MMEPWEEAITPRVETILQQIEQDYGVTILYACESGSRCWGIDSPNSDYDVRFLYVRPLPAYLEVYQHRDVIERPIIDELDVNGWDILKAARLLAKSNPPLLEWLISPVVYRAHTPLSRAFQTIAIQSYSPRALAFHYLHMLRGNYLGYIAGKETVLLKKYLYVLRPLFALLFLQRYRLLPPVHMLATLEGTMDAVPLEIVQRTTAIMERKQQGEELGEGPPDPVLNRWLETMIGTLQLELANAIQEPPPVTAINGALANYFGLEG